MLTTLKMLHLSARGARRASARLRIASFDWMLAKKKRRSFGTMPNDFPSEARVVVVGGGVIGSSILYHLARMEGFEAKDAVLIEQSKLTSGTTWHAAGLMVTFGSMSETSTELRKYSKELYQKLEEETGQATGFNPCGFIELATNGDYLEEYRRTAAFNRACGVDVEEISPAEVKKMFPLCDVDDVLAGFYVKDDGRVNPVDVTAALAKGARMRGARIFEDTDFLGVTTSDDGKSVAGVSTSRGHIKCEKVINACGMYARQVGELSGINVPNQAAEHYYLVTDSMPEVDPSWPVIEDPSSHTYIRPEGGGLMIGLFEPDAAAWAVEGIPKDFSFGEIEPDWERMAPFLEKAMRRVPSSAHVGMKKFFCGPESFTPDLAPIVGEAPEMKNYFVAAGLNSIGILSGGGIGRLVANWVVEGKPDMDVTGMNIDRLHAYQSTPSYRRDRVEESLGMVYKCHYPHYSRKTARGVKRSPLHSKLEKRDACFREVSGWEAADWYAPSGMKPDVGKLSWGRHAWFEQWGVEHRACREGVVLMDMSFMSKFMVQGRDAGKMLNELSTANVDGDENTITYTQWLNDNGKLEADLTVTKLARDKFMVVATDTAHRHVETMMSRCIDDGDYSAFVCDVTGAYAQINLQGPKSRDVLQCITSCDVSNSMFPFRRAEDIDIGYCNALCARITYLGELGYELYVPTESAVHVYERIVEEGSAHGLVHAGLKALSSLRLEKGYRDYGHDMDNTDSLVECGLTFTCDFSKDSFVGKDAVLEEKSRGVPKRRLLQILVDDPEPLMYHGEIVYRDGKIISDVRAASYGFTLGGSVGLFMAQDPDGKKITKRWVSEGDWSVDIAGKQYPAKVSIRPMYDPSNDAIKM